MPRQKRADEAGSIYHALNRGNARSPIFHQEEDYESFPRVLEEALDRYPVELFAFSLMPDHWHLVLRTGENGQMGRLLRWVTATQTLRHHANHRTTGEGHLYQSRFKSFPVAEDDHFLLVCRYVEANPLRSDLVQQAEDWKYSSLSHWIQKPEHPSKLLSPWPIPRTPNWVERVNEPLSAKELAAIRLCVQRGRPFGNDDWVAQKAERTGLGYTLRSRGRPSQNELPS